MTINFDKYRNMPVRKLAARLERNREVRFILDQRSSMSAQQRLRDILQGGHNDQNN